MPNYPLFIYVIMVVVGSSLLCLLGFVLYFGFKPESKEKKQRRFKHDKLAREQKLQDEEKIIKEERLLDQERQKQLTTEKEHLEFVELDIYGSFLIGVSALISFCYLLYDFFVNKNIEYYLVLVILPALPLSSIDNKFKVGDQITKKEYQWIAIYNTFLKTVKYLTFALIIIMLINWFSGIYISSNKIIIVLLVIIIITQVSNKHDYK